MIHQNCQTTWWKPVTAKREITSGAWGWLMRDMGRHSLGNWWGGKSFFSMLPMVPSRIKTYQKLIFSTLPMFQEGSALCHTNWLVTRTSPRRNWFRNIHFEDPDWTACWSSCPKFHRSIYLSVDLSICKNYIHTYLDSRWFQWPTHDFLDQDFRLERFWGMCPPAIEQKRWNKPHL